MEVFKYSNLNILHLNRVRNIKEKNVCSVEKHLLLNQIHLNFFDIHFSREGNVKFQQQCR